MFFFSPNDYFHTFTKALKKYNCISKDLKRKFGGYDFFSEIIWLEILEVSKSSHYLFQNCPKATNSESKYELAPPNTCSIVVYQHLKHLQELTKLLHKVQ